MMAIIKIVIVASLIAAATIGITIGIIYAATPITVTDGCRDITPPTTLEYVIVLGSAILSWNRAWAPSGCEINFEVSYYVNGELLQNGSTYGNQYVFPISALPGCSIINFTLTAISEGKHESAPVIAETTTDIDEISLITLDGDAVSWILDNDQSTCTFRIEMNDEIVEENFDETVYELSAVPMCQTNEITITPIHFNGDVGTPKSFQFERDFQPITSMSLNVLNRNVVQITYDLIDNVDLCRERNGFEGFSFDCTLEESPGRSLISVPVFNRELRRDSESGTRESTTGSDNIGFSASYAESTISGASSDSTVSSITSSESIDITSSSPSSTESSTDSIPGPTSIPESSTDNTESSKSSSEDSIESTGSPESSTEGSGDSVASSISPSESSSTDFPITSGETSDGTVTSESTDGISSSVSSTETSTGTADFDISSSEGSTDSTPSSVSSSESSTGSAGSSVSSSESTSIESSTGSSSETTTDSTGSSSASPSDGTDSSIESSTDSTITTTLSTYGSTESTNSSTLSSEDTDATTAKTVDATTSADSTTIIDSTTSSTYGSTESTDSSTSCSEDTDATTAKTVDFTTSADSTTIIDSTTSSTYGSTKSTDSSTSSSEDTDATTAKTVDFTTSADSTTINDSTTSFTESTTIMHLRGYHNFEDCALESNLSVFTMSIQPMTTGTTTTVDIICTYTVAVEVEGVTELNLTDGSDSICPTY